MQRDQAHKTNELLERIAIALEKNTANVVYNGELKNTKDIPGFEGTLEDLHNIKLHTDEGESCDDDHVHNDYLNDIVTDMTKEQYVKFFLDMDFGFALSDTAAFNNHIYELDYEEVLDCIKSALHITGELDIEERIKNDYASNPFGHNDAPTSSNPDPAGYGNKDPYTYDNDLNEYCDGIKNDSDHDIRSTAQYYNDEIHPASNIKTKKDAILDYVTNEFGALGARYTDIIKFAYYLGEHNKLKYDSRDRGYYSCAFNVRLNGHLIQGGKDCLVKGINKEGDERYFALSSVDNFTGFWKYIK